MSNQTINENIVSDVSGNTFKSEFIQEQLTKQETFNNLLNDPIYKDLIDELFVEYHVPFTYPLPKLYKIKPEKIQEVFEDMTFYVVGNYKKDGKNFIQLEHEYCFNVDEDFLEKVDVDYT
jgi:hypothetical protein